jgi:hypothetical protein
MTLTNQTCRQLWADKGSDARIFVSWSMDEGVNCKSHRHLTFRTWPRVQTQLRSVCVLPNLYPSTSDMSRTPSTPTAPSTLLAPNYSSQSEHRAHPPCKTTKHKPLTHVVAHGARSGLTQHQLYPLPARVNSLTLPRSRSVAASHNPTASTGVFLLAVVLSFALAAHVPRAINITRAATNEYTHAPISCRASSPLTLSRLYAGCIKSTKVLVPSPFQSSSHARTRLTSPAWSGDTTICC